MKNIIGLIAITALVCVGCAPATAPAEKPAKKTSSEAKKGEAAPATLKTGKGVNAKGKTITIATLNALSGPAAMIGKPFGVGKQVLIKQANDPASKLLPKGWKIEMIEKDHGYNPAKSQQTFQAIKDQVLFINSFGTPPTLPLRPYLKKDSIVAFPASLSSEMANFEYTPPIGPGYNLEARRAMDFAIKQAGGADKVKAAILYQGDDYGKDGLKGWKRAAADRGVTIVGERAIKRGQKDFTAEIIELNKAGANYVLLTVLPSATGPILGTAIKMKFMPNWIGNTPAWVDAFFAHPKLPPVVFSKFYWATGLPYWGEKVPGMDTFLKAYQQHGQSLHRPDFYLLAAYVQGLASIEAIKRAIEAGDITRVGYLNALKSMRNFNAGGMMQPADLSKFPYATGDRTRILKPDFAKKTWSVAGGYAAPVAKAVAK
jgi:ABC-type branched-subunit amino acid transport system substrate-binding protein